MNTTRIAVALLSVALGSGLVGCVAPTAPTAGASVDPSRVSPTGLPTPPIVTDSKGDVKDLVLGDCKTAAGEQVVTGELTSTLTTPADFLVTVSWTTASGDVMGRGFKVIQDLVPGKKTSFEIKATVAPGATQCVKGVEYGTIKA